MLQLFLAVAMAAMLVIGFLASKLVKTSEDYLVAGRRLGLAVTTGTFTATFISASSLTGGIGLAYLHGLSVQWNYTVGSLLSVVVLVAFLASKLRRFAGLTLPDIFGARFGKGAHGVAAIIVFLSMIAAMGVQLIAMGIVLSTVLGLPLGLSMFIGAAITVVYTILGGFIAEALTDFVQMLLMYVGVAIASLFALHTVGGLGELLKTVTATKPTLLIGTGPKATYAFAQNPIWIFAVAIAFTMGNCASPHQVTRLYAARDARTAIRASALSGVLLFVWYGLFLPTIGISSYVILGPSVKNADFVFPMFINKVLPAPVASLMFASIIMTIMSTVDSMALVAGMTLSRDIYQVLINPKATDRQLLLLSRIAVAVLTAGAIAVALWYPSLITIMNIYIYGTMGAAFFAPMVATLYWKRATAQGVIASILTGAATVVVWTIMKNPFGIHSAVPGLVGCLIALVAVSLATPPQPEDSVASFFSRVGG